MGVAAGEKGGGVCGAAVAEVGEVGGGFEERGKGKAIRAEASAAEGREDGEGA